MVGSWWPFWPFNKGASSSPANFVHLSRTNIERMCSLASHEEALNPHQCRSVSSTLERTMRSIEHMVDSVDDINHVCGSAALENFYRVSVKANQLVENCCRDDWCREAAFQIQNEEAFKEILLETSLCYNTICEVVEGINQKREFLHGDLRESSAFDPPSADEAFKDLVALQNRLEGLIDEVNFCDSHIRSQHLGKYLLGRVRYALEHSRDEDFDVRSFNLWADGQGPGEEWSEKSEFLGGNVCKTAWLDVPCAKKMFQDEMLEDEWLAEAKILASLNHPNIVKFICCNKYETEHTRGHFIAMEHMDTSLGSFIKRLTDQGAKLSLFQALDIILQIAYGMCYLHENGIAHRDLKTSNVVVRKISAPQLQYYLQVKVVDFGISKVKLQDKSSTMTRPKIGTTLYMPPEVFPLDGRVNWFKADVYSFSVMCSVILSGGEPFQDIKRTNLCGAICSGTRPILPGDIPQELASVIREGWAMERNSRPSIFDICTRLEKLRHCLVRDRTLGSSFKQEEYSYFNSYIEKVTRTRSEARERARQPIFIQSIEDLERLDGAEMEDNLPAVSEDVLPTNLKVVVLQQGQAAQRQQQLLNLQVVHHPQAQQAFSQQQQASSAQQIGNQCLAVGTPPQLSNHLKQLQQLQRMQVQLQLEHNFQQAVQRYQQMEPLLHHQQEHAQVQAQVQALAQAHVHVRQHQRSHAPLIQPPVATKSKGLVPLLQQLTQTLSTPVLQQGGLLHRQDQLHHGPALALLRDSVQSAIPSNPGEASNHQEDIGELRGIDSNGASKRPKFLEVLAWIEQQKSAAVHRASPSQLAIPIRPTPTPATKSQQSRPGDVKLFGQSLLCQPTFAVATQTARHLPASSAERASLQLSPFYFTSSSPVTSMSVPSTTAPKFYGKQSAFKGVPFILDSCLVPWPPAAIPGSMGGESEHHNMQETRMSREARHGESEQTML